MPLDESGFTPISGTSTARYRSMSKGQLSVGPRVSSVLSFRGGTVHHRGTAASQALLDPQALVRIFPSVSGQLRWCVVSGIHLV